MILYYTIFDREEDQVCFGEAKHDKKMQNYVISADGIEESSHL
jgi:hypothetical protein